MINRLVGSIPSLIAIIIGKQTISKKTIKQAKKEAKKESKYKHDWCWELIDGENESTKEEKYMFEIKYTQCGILNYWKELGIEEYLAATCSIDYYMFRKAKVKLIRTKTLSMGGECCDFKFFGSVKDIEELVNPEQPLNMPDWKEFVKKRNEKQKKYSPKEEEIVLIEKNKNFI